MVLRNGDGLPLEDADEPFVQHFGQGSSGAVGTPGLVPRGAPFPGAPLSIEVTRVSPGSIGLLFISDAVSQVPLPKFEGMLLLEAPLVQATFSAAPPNASTIPFAIDRVPAELQGQAAYFQAVVLDAEAQRGLAFSAGLGFRVGPHIESEIFPVTSLKGGLKANRLVQADFDGDGRADLGVLGHTQPGASFYADTFAIFTDPKGTGLERTASMPVDDAIAVAVGNLDGTPFPDLVLAPLSEPPSPAPGGFPLPTSIRFCSGLGDGSFDCRISYDSAIFIGFLLAEDLDADGDLDVLVAGASPESPGLVESFLNRGDGLLQSAGVTDLDAGINGVLLEDLDGDEVSDLIVLDVVDDGVRVSQGLGDGTFGPALSIPLGLDLRAMASGHLNSDPHPDLVLADGREDRLYVLPGNGRLTFGAPIPVESFPDPTYVWTGDADQDGTDEVYASDPIGDSIWAYRPLEKDPLDPGIRYLTGDHDRRIAADFDGDGIGELVLASTQMTTLGMIEFQADGTLTAPVASGVAGGTPLLADWNGDDVPDLTRLGLFPPKEAAVTIAFGQGDGSFGDPYDVPIQLYSDAPLGEIASGDLNGDGRPDLIVSTAGTGLAPTVGGGVLWLPNNGDGTFGNAIGVTGPGGPWYLEVADLNRDGHLDLVAACEEPPLFPTPATQGRLEVFLGQTGGAFAPPETYLVGQNITSLEVGDLSGDGRLDLFVRVTEESLFQPPLQQFLLLTALPDGSIGDPVDSGLPSSTTEAFLGDANADGLLDYLVSRAALLAPLLPFEFEPLPGQIWLGQGQGAFLPPLELPIAGPIDALEDLDADGIPDLVVTADGLQFLKGTGEGSFCLAGSFGGSTRERVTVSADLDRNGLVDLLGPAADEPGVVSLLNRLLGD